MQLAAKPLTAQILCSILKIFFTFFAHFLILCNSSAFLELDYKEVSFRFFDSGSIDVQTKIVLSVVWQLAAFKDNLSKYCPSELV